MKIPQNDDAIPTMKKDQNKIQYIATTIARLPVSSLKKAKWPAAVELKWSTFEAVKN